jgi:glycosyltransferase involved in cell wall biosynthesis
VITVFIPTYNPNLNRLNQTLEGLKDQTLKKEDWEIIIVDNNSSISFDKEIDLDWHPNTKIVSETKQGLTYARIKGIETAKYEVIVMVDDDNILDKNYLKNVIQIFENYHNLGAIGGKSIPSFEEKTDDWLKEFYHLLALRDLGNEVLMESFANKYPKCSPIGAGMAFRKTAIQSYLNRIQSSNSAISDRKGNDLSSSGDNDMVYEMFKSGWDVGYFPQLSLQHIIPKSRTTVEYLARLNFGIQKSWVQFLVFHRISPWKQISIQTVFLRKLKSYFTNKAWKSEANYIKWKGACGMFEGLTK